MAVPLFAIFLDIEKAFDTVWHNGLIYKLIKSKCPNYLIKTIHSYLQNRTFVFSYKSSISTVKTISAGVPQGSVLGPNLYNFFTHDTPKTNDTQLQMYADDTTLFASSLSENRASMRFKTTCIYSQNITVNGRSG